MVQKSGDKENIALGEISKIAIPEGEMDQIPLHSLVVNPCDPMIPDEQKIKIGWRFPFGHDYYAEVFFMGACKQYKRRKKQIVYQIAVYQLCRDKVGANFVANFITDPVIKETDDMGLALEAMEEEITGNLIYQVADRMKQAIQQYKIDQKLGKDPGQIPWFIINTKTMVAL